MEDSLPASRAKRVRDIATLVAAIVVPLLVAFFGWRINTTLAEYQLRADYLRLSVEVLSRELPENGDSTQVERALRSWAVDVFADNSPETLDSVVLDALRSGSLLLDGSGGGSSSFSFSYGTDGLLPEECRLVVTFQTTLYGDLLSTRAVQRLSAGEYQALELRTPDSQLIPDQRVRLADGWVDADLDNAYLDCTSF